MLAEAGVQSLTDQLVVMDLAATRPSGAMERRILLDLPVAARSLAVTAETREGRGLV